MKSVIASAILMATSAQACIRVHASMWSSGTFHDVMSVDVWDNNDFHCTMDQTKSGVSAATRWDFQCGDDRYYKVTLWDNGGSGVVEHRVAEGNIWSANLNLRDSAYESNCIAPTESGNGCMSYETERIFAFDDGFGNCETITTHAALISSLSALYLTLIDLEHLREDEVQFPPHTGRNKIPLATTAPRPWNLTQEAEQLLQLLPYIYPARLSKLFHGESCITISSKPLSYLDNGDGEEDCLHDARSFGYGDNGAVMLPSWASSDVPVTDPSFPLEKLSELSSYEPTEHELAAAAVTPEDLIGVWARNLLTLAWVSWRDDEELSGMQMLDDEDESWLADPENWRQELIARNGPMTLNDLDGQPFGNLPTAEQRLLGTWRARKKKHNRWWEKRLVYEGAGWPDALDKEILRMCIRNFEQERLNAMDNAGPGSNEPMCQRF
ncbi:hypothetical protein MBLNU13_g11595t2 [Cladosporium sp. NU13]